MLHRLLLLTLRTVSISQQYMMESTVEECMAYSQFSNIDFLLPLPPSTPADITDSVTLLDTLKTGASLYSQASNAVATVA